MLLRGAFVPPIETIGTQEARKRGADHDGEGAFFHASCRHGTEHGWHPELGDLQKAYRTQSYPTFKPMAY